MSHDYNVVDPSCPKNDASYADTRYIKLHDTFHKADVRCTGVRSCNNSCDILDRCAVNETENTCVLSLEPSRHTMEAL
jgi:hypothetical protein